MTSVTVVALFIAGAIVAVLWYRERARTRATNRLDAILREPAAVTPQDEPAFEDRLPVFPRRYRALAVAAGIFAGVGAWWFAVPIEVAAALGALAGVLAYLAEDFIAERRIGRIETQLSETIDLLVGALRAGSALLAALEASLRASQDPIRPYLQEMAGRIRLGDDPREVLAALPRKVPLETFRLFAMALAVHWEVGGSLASTLSTVGRTIRDRIELSRRVRAQGVEAHVSVAAVLVIAYVLGYLMWRTNPDRMEAFVRSAVGTELVTTVIGLQAVGLVWMSKISRSGY